MREKILVVLAVLVCLSTAALADSITSVSPRSFNLGDVEQYLLIQGDNLAGAVGTTVVYSGPAGTFSVPANDAEPTQIFAWVPVEVLVTSGGTYDVTVLADDGTNVRTIGPAQIDIIAPVNPGTPPLLSLPEVLNVEATDSSGATATYFAGSNDGSPVTCDHPSGSVFPLGATVVNCSATNAFGTSNGSFTLFVQDTVAPVVTVPADIHTSNPVVTFSASAVDAVDGTVTVTCSPASGSTFAPGTTRVTCVAVDGAGNPGYGIFNVVLPGGPPVISVPADITAEATSAAGAVVTFTATSTNDGVVTCTPASGSTFAIGTTAVSCTATNDAGSSSAGFNVIVKDTTPPSLTLPANITAEATSAAGATVTFTTSASDLVDGSVSVSCTPASGSVFPLGTTTVSCHATDAHGNTSNGSFTVKVQDTTPPQVLRITATPSQIWPPNHKMVDVTIAVQAIDAVDPSPTSTIVSVTSNQPINGPGDGNTNTDWQITGPLTLQLRAERAQGSDRHYVITVKTQDASGNFVLSTVEVVVGQTKGRAAGH